MILQKLEKAGVIHPPRWLSDNTHYLTMMGSVAYGVSSDASDMDVYGFCMPPKDMVFPHLAGEIIGFGRQVQRFDQWSEHHVKDVGANKEYDFAVYSIVKFFQLVMENNPNMIDSLFTPRRCIIHSTHIAELVRENRKMFLHKGSWHKFKGYAYSNFNKYKLSNREKLKDVVAFRKLHSIQNTGAVLNNLRMELSRRGMPEPETWRTT